MKKEKPICLPDRAPRYEDVLFANVILDNCKSFELKMDIYQSPEQTEPGPCIVYFFGGGWLWGNYKQKENRAVYFRDLVKLVDSGFTIISPAYRLVDQAIFPAAIHDCKGAIRFLKANSDTYHIDTDRIGTLGNSAGGHLAAMVAMSANRKEMEGNVGGNLEYSSTIKAAALFYAPPYLLDFNEECNGNVAGSKNTDKKTEIGGGETEVGQGKFIDMVENSPDAVALGFAGPGKGTPVLIKIAQAGDQSVTEWKHVELARACSPITYINEKCPPMVILHGEQDPVVPIRQSEVFYKALAAAGADVTYVSQSFAGHGPSIGSDADRLAYNFLTSRL